MASFTEKRKQNINTKNTNKKQQRQQTNKIYTNDKQKQMTEITLTFDHKNIITWLFTSTMAKRKRIPKNRE
jgi:outer membrane protein assembly factor BamE (lipoprotein component of BamABCDE complex)